MYTCLGIWVHVVCTYRYLHMVFNISVLDNSCQQYIFIKTLATSQEVLHVKGHN